MKDEIVALISKGQIEEAISTLMKKVDKESDVYQELILYASELNIWNKESRMGLNPDPTIKRRITKSVLETFKEYKQKSKENLRAFWWTGCKNNGIDIDSDFYMTVVNETGGELPFLNVHIFPSNTFQLEPITEITNSLLPNQYAMYKFVTLDENGNLTKYAKKFLKEKEKLSIRIFPKNTSGEHLLLSYELGEELRRWIEGWKIQVTNPKDLDEEMRAKKIEAITIWLEYVECISNKFKLEFEDDENILIENKILPSLVNCANIKQINGFIEFIKKQKEICG